MQYFAPSSSPTENAISAVRRLLMRCNVYLTVLSLLSLFCFNLVLTRPFDHDKGTLDSLEVGLTKCQFNSAHRPSPVSRSNPRWNQSTGQKNSLVLRNATLFDGDRVLDYAADIFLKRGVVEGIYPTSQNQFGFSAVTTWDLKGRFVTPGLVDMHSHHLLLPFPRVQATTDVNEKPFLGTLTPFIRAIDGFKPYDQATRIIASGGVTTSLILPGSGNLIGGEGYMVKNAMFAGVHAEPRVDDLLLDFGIPEAERQRYMKMACGENPKHTYGHTRMGNLWLLRDHFAKAKAVQQQQDGWCLEAAKVNRWSFGEGFLAARFIGNSGPFPETQDLELTVAALRGLVNINVHSYEPQDIQQLITVLAQYEVLPQAFHHALEAWQIPELLKQYNENITVATFADNAFFKHEAYDASLRAGKILTDHGVAVAYKSDHTGEASNAKYLMFQASVAHSFDLPTTNALRSVTSIPARSLQQDHRIGYVRAGYDADLVVWDDHPLQVGATPMEVFVDGEPQLNSDNAVDSSTFPEIPTSLNHVPVAPKPRLSKSKDAARQLCVQIAKNKDKLVFTGIQKVLIDAPLPSKANNLTLVLINGRIACLHNEKKCALTAAGGHVIALDHGYVTPGLTAVTQTLGLIHITGEPSTGDGQVSSSVDVSNPNNVVFAKYGAHLDGKAFDRARLGGITKAVTPPLSGTGLLQGVSVGIRTRQDTSLLSNGIFKEDVALHFRLGQASKGQSTPTISGAISKLRGILAVEGANTDIYHEAAVGKIPIVIHALNKHDTSQVVLLKQDFPNINVVIYGGHGAPFVAKELAEARIPVILTGNRGAPDSWEKRDSLIGRPLTITPAEVLAKNGVLFGLALPADSRLYNLAAEAGWAAKYIGLNEKSAINLVSTNIDLILGLGSKLSYVQSNNTEYLGDIVIWEGNPLKGEGSVVATFEGDERYGSCWPDIL